MSSNSNALADAVMPDNPAAAEEIATQMISETQTIIDKQGYCLWTCAGLGGAVICVVKDSRVEDEHRRLAVSWEQFFAMQQHPVYTLAELEMLGRVSDWTERMILEAKRYTGAEVIKIKTKRR